MLSPNNAIDSGVGVVAITTPVWFQLVTPYVTGFMLVGGAALLALRLAIAVHEWKTRNHR